MAYDPKPTSYLKLYLANVCGGAMTAGSAALASTDNPFLSSYAIPGAPGGETGSDVGAPISVMGVGPDWGGGYTLPPGTVGAGRPFDNNLMLVSSIASVTNTGHVTLAAAATHAADGNADGEYNVAIYREISARAESIAWSSSLAARDTLSFELLSKDGSYRPTHGMPVLLRDTNPDYPRDVFGGVVDSVEHTNIPGTAAVTTKCTCISWDLWLSRRLVKYWAGSYSGLDLATLAKRLVWDHAGSDGLSVSSVTGPTIGNIMFSLGANVMDALAAACQTVSGTDTYYFYTDAWRVVHLVKQNTTAAAWKISTADGSDSNVLAQVSARFSGEKMANRWLVQANAELQPAAPEAFKGDGTKRTFNVSGKVGAAPTITKNGSSQTVGVEGIDSGKQWYWSQGSNSINQDAGGTTLSSSDSLTITYQGLGSSLAFYQAGSSVTARAATEGGTGFYDGLLVINYVTQPGDGAAIAQSRANTFGELPASVEVISFRGGLKTADAIEIVLPNVNVNGTFLIDAASLVTRQNRVGYKYHAVAGPLIDEWSQAFTGGGQTSAGGGNAAPPTPTPGTVALSASFAGTPGQVGVAYSAPVVAVGGTTPYAFAVITGSLPAGLSLNTSTGVISGTPTTAGTSSFTVRVTDAASATADAACTINIQLPSGTSTAATVSFPTDPSDNTGARWSDPAQHAVITAPISLTAGPRTVTFWAGPHLGTRVWRGVWTVPSGATTVSIGARGSNSEVFPPTAANETWEVVVAVGAYGPVDAIPSGAVTSNTFTMHAPNVYASTGSSSASAATVLDVGGTAGAKQYVLKFDFGLPLADPDFFFARLTRQIGKYVAGVWTPLAGQPTFEGVTGTPIGDWALPTYFKPDDVDHAPVFGLTGAIQSSGLTTVRCSWGPFPYPDDGNDTIKVFLYLGTRKDDGSGGTKTQQATWPAGASSYDVTLDPIKSRITKVKLATANGTMGADSSTTGLTVYDGTAGDGTDPITYITPAQIDLLDPADGAPTSILHNEAFLCASKFILDTLGKATKYNNVALSGKGIAHIIYRDKQTGQTSSATLLPTIPAGLYRLNVTVWGHANNFSATGTVSVTASAANNNGLAGVTDLIALTRGWSTSVVYDITASGSMSLTSGVFYTDGSVVGSIHGLSVSFSASSWSNASYSWYVVLEKLDDA